MIKLNIKYHCLNSNLTKIKNKITYNFKLLSIFKFCVQQKIFITTNNKLFNFIKILYDE